MKKFNNQKSKIKVNYKDQTLMRLLSKKSFAGPLIFFLEKYYFKNNSLKPLTARKIDNLINGKMRFLAFSSRLSNFAIKKIFLSSLKLLIATKYISRLLIF